jgi:hypothetical protein
MAARLRQTEIAGEFADATGAIVVRRVSWQDEHSSGHAVLVHRDTLARTCVELGVELAFDDYAELRGQTFDAKWDHKPFPRRWRLTFTTKRESSKDVVLRTSEWEVVHGSLEPKERFRRYHWSGAHERGLEIALCKAELSRASSAGDTALSRKLERRLRELVKEVRDEG